MDTSAQCNHGVKAAHFWQIANDRYFENEKASRETYNQRGQGWLRTGDEGTRKIICVRRLMASSRVRRRTVLYRQ